MISIIIPYHNEDLRPLLMSVATQQRTDFGQVEVIVITDDKEPVVPDYGLNVRVLRNGKAGYMGVSRQIGIDAATGDHLLFIDADDILYLNTLLYDLTTRLDGSDVYAFRFAEETESGYVTHDAQFTWMFAKLYRRQFLTDHGVRFHDDILWHEDTYFNQVLLAYRPTVRYLDYVGYVWRWHPDTITRRNGAEYTTRSIPMYADALSKRLERTFWVHTAAEREELITEDVAYLYCMCQSLYQPDLLREHIGVIEAAVGEYLRKWSGDFVKERRTQIARRLRGSDIIPREGVMEWHDRLMKGGANGQE